MFFYKKSEKYLFFLLAISFFLSSLGLFHFALVAEANIEPISFLKEGNFTIANLLYTLLLMLSMPIYFIYQYKKGFKALSRLLYFYWFVILLAVLNLGMFVYYFN